MKLIFMGYIAYEININFLYYFLYSTSCFTNYNLSCIYSIFLIKYSKLWLEKKKKNSDWWPIEIGITWNGIQKVVL